MSDRSELHNAASKGDYNKVRNLINQNSEIDPVDELGWTPLMIASSAGYFEIVNLLIQKGANVNSSNNNGQTALHYAVSKNHTAICKLLLENKANVNAQDNLLCTPLHRAASKGYSSLIELLCQQKGIDVNISDSMKNTPLKLSFEENRIDDCKLLLKYGAKIPEMTELGIKVWNKYMTDYPITE